MTMEKRDELIASGQLNPDGSRIEKCPTCGHILTAEEVEALRGSAVAVAEPAHAQAVDPASAPADAAPVGEGA